MKSYMDMWKEYRDWHDECWRKAEISQTIEEMERHLKHAGYCMEMMNFYEAKIRQGWK